MQAETGPRPVIGGERGRCREAEGRGRVRGAEDRSPRPASRSRSRRAGKSTKRLSLLSGGEKSLVALAFMFAVFLARPCPFYILDEVEAALDDINIDRFLQLVRRYSDRAQFIVVTHQKRTMDAADTPLRREHGRRRHHPGGVAQAGRKARRRSTSLSSAEEAAA